MAGLGLWELGSTGLKVTSLGYGCSPLGNAYGYVAEEDAIASVHEAARLGINYFDVAPSYGDTLAETVLGKALKTMPIPRESYVVSTKCGRYGGGCGRPGATTEISFDFSAERVTRSVDESLARLNLDYLDIIFCHDIEFSSLDQILNETIPALQAVKESGKVRHIGISGLPLKIFSHILDRAPKGAVEVVLSYAHHSLNDTSLLELLPYLKSKGVGLINASPLSLGLLTEKGTPHWHPAPLEIKTICAQAAKACKEEGKSIAKLAVQYALRNRSLTTTLIGMPSVAEVRENVRIAIEAEHGTLDIDEELLQQVQQILQPVKNKTWPSGLLENN